MRDKYTKALHWLLIAVLLSEGLYGFYMVFFVIGGSRWPLFMRAVETPVEVILRRRLYAIESWIAVGALAIYLGITEIQPWGREISEREEERR